MHVQGMSLPTVMFATFDYTGKTRMESVTEKLLRFELKSPSGVIMSKKVVAIVGSYRKGGTVDTAGCPVLIGRAPTSDSDKEILERRRSETAVSIVTYDEILQKQAAQLPRLF
jgi:hypothetical protein